MNLLRRAPSFRSLFLATLGSSLGTLLATVALVIDVKDRTNSGPWVGALMFVEFLPAVAVGLFFGPYLDRLPRRGLMVVSDLVRFGVFCTLPFSNSAGAVAAPRADRSLPDRLLPPGRLCGAPESGVRTGPRSCEFADPDERERELDARAGAGRSAGRPVEPRHRVLGECRDVPPVGAAARPHPGGQAP